jgi:hypothetical protein
MILDTTAHDELPAGYETLLQELWSRRPPAVLFGSIAVVVALCLVVAAVVLSFLDHPMLAGLFAGNMIAGDMSSVMRLGLVGLAMVDLWLVWRLLAGKAWARLALLSVASIAVVIELVDITIAKSTSMTIAALVTAGLHIVIVLLFSSNSARQFTKIH